MWMAALIALPSDVDPALGGAPSGVGERQHYNITLAA
jgi:hypothetical protein